MRTLLAVAVGGALGGITRWGVSALTGGSPLATVAVNVTGAYLLALLLVLSVEVWPPRRHLRPFAATGFLGSFTTFSTWVVELDRMLLHGQVAAFSANLVASTAGGLGAAFLGLVTGRALTRRSSPPAAS